MCVPFAPPALQSLDNIRKECVKIIKIIELNYGNPIHEGKYKKRAIIIYLLGKLQFNSP